MAMVRPPTLSVPACLPWRQGKTTHMETAVLFLHARNGRFSSETEAVASVSRSRFVNPGARRV
eukprot:84378-Chlamydomonas_euryale.AAC.1